MKRFVTLLVVVAALLCLSASAANTQGFWKKAKKSLKKFKKVSANRPDKTQTLKKFKKVSANRPDKNRISLQVKKAITNVISKAQHFINRPDIKMLPLQYLSKQVLNVKVVKATNKCVKHLPMEGGELQFDFSSFDGKGYTLKGVDNIDGNPAIYTNPESDVNVLSTRCVDGNAKEKASLVCKILNSPANDCTYNKKNRFAFSIVAKSSENEKRMCVNICLQCPNHLNCAAQSKRYYTKVMEMGTGDACTDVCDKNIALANVQKRRRRLLQGTHEGC